MQTIDVDGLRFEFDHTWRALKWDDHRAYRSGLNGHAGTKAIDIVALRHEDQLWLIEGGSLRTAAARIHFKNKRAAKREPLHEEFAGKVRDTIAASVWVQDRHPEAPALVPYLRAALRGSAGKVRAVLWFEGLEEAELVALEDQVSASLR